MNRDRLWHLRRMLLLAPLLAAPACATALGGGEPRLLSEQLPVRRVVLYQNGVGYFEREGKLSGNLLSLHCRPSQINDLLKSLTVIDRGSGRPLSISLPLEKGGDKVLAELPKQVRDAAGLLDVLRVFRGARVRLHGEGGEVTGRVVGVEQGLGASSKDVAGGWSVTLKDERGDLVVYRVPQVQRVELLDRTLEAGLEKSLDVSLEEGNWKSISLSVRLAGAEDHDLLVSYIVEMPMWKPAYRLVLQKERPPLLQGWAIIDNVSGESWRDVHLSLVTGTPMSFVYDLHSPRFARRPDLSPGTRVALAPPPEEAGREADTKNRLQMTYAHTRRASGAATGEESEDARKNAPADRAPATKAPEADDSSRLNLLLERQLESVKTEVKGEKVGSLFRYDLKDPVTVPDSSSTLVNIVNSRVPGEEVVLFRPELTARQAASHPYRAVRFKNDSGFALEAGPVTIYASGTFVGEGFLERMEKGQAIFLTYAIDANVTMAHTRSWGEEAVRLLKIRRGQIESEVVQLQRATYSVSNAHDVPVLAYVKSIRPGGDYKLRQPPPGTVETPEASYLPLAVPARGKKDLLVEWATPVRRWLAIDTSLSTTVLKMYLSSGTVPTAARATLEKILVAKDRLNGLEAESARVQHLKASLSEDQARVRANLDLLRKVKGNEALKGKLTRNLSSLEEQLSRLTARYVKIDEEKAGLLGEMQALIGQITLDAS